MTLDLDNRQRAMLAEMGVRVWAPQADVNEADSTPMPPAQEVLPTKVTVPVERAPTPAAPQSRPMTNLTPSSVNVADMGWHDLQEAVATCQACGLCQTRKNTVFGVGAAAPADQAPQVDWLIVGEAPGENEDLQGEPFVGQAGRLLDNMLKACGLSRHGAKGPESGGVYIANVLKCRPPGNRNPMPQEVAQCEPFLRRQVQLLQPKIIVAMGRFAVQSLLAESVPQVHAAPLGKLRGQIHHYQGVPVVVTYHPAYLLRSLTEKAKAWADLSLAITHLREHQ